jgi:hypothetical protein
MANMATQPEDGKHGIPLINVTTPLIDAKAELLSADPNNGNRSRASSATVFSETDRGPGFTFDYTPRGRKGKSRSMLGRC